jgi:hypothetical protein
MMPLIVWWWAEVDPKYYRGMRIFVTWPGVLSYRACRREYTGGTPVLPYRRREFTGGTPVLPYRRREYTGGTPVLPYRRREYTGGTPVLPYRRRRRGSTSAS